MKRNSLVQLTLAWWKEHEPKGLASGKDFGKSLAEYEIAQAALRKTGADGALDASLKTLKNIETAAAKVLAEATKLAKIPPKDPKKPTHDVEEQAWTVDAFKKIDKVIDEARAQAHALHRPPADAKEEEEPDEGNALTSPDAFKLYLKTSLTRLRKTPMNMALVVGKVPQDSRALLHKSTAGRALASRLAKETGIKKAAYGTAVASEDDAAAIVFTLEGPKISGLKKHGELMLKAFKPLPFTRFIVMVEGREDLSEDDDAQEAGEEENEDQAQSIPKAPPLPGGDSEKSARFTKRLKDLLPAINQAVQADVAGANEARQKAADAAALLRKGHVDAALESLDQAEKRLKAALTARAASKAAPQAPAATGGPADGGFSLVNLQKSRLAWQAARKAVQDQLRKLEDTIVAELAGDPDLPDLPRDIRKLDEVLRTLDARLIDRLDDALNAKTSQERQRLHQEASGLMDGYRAYVSNDALVADLEANPFTPIAIRSTVLRTLDALQKTLGSPHA